MTKNWRVNSKKCVAGGGGWQVERATSLPQVSSWKSWSGQNLFLSSNSSHVSYGTNVRITREWARRAVLQDEGLSQPMEASRVATAPSVPYKTGAPGAQRHAVSTIEGEGEPRRDIVSQGWTSGAEEEHHNRCCTWRLHRNAAGLPRQQNGLATCFSPNIHRGWWASLDTWHVPSITVRGQAGDGTEYQAEHNLTFQRPHQLSPCWSSSERSTLCNGMKRAPFQTKQRYLWIKVKFGRLS